MFVRIGNTPRDYAWGSSGGISRLLGTAPTGKPEAELWLGAHAGSPSIILDREATGGASDLAAWIADDPQDALGAASGSLPYLLKVLAADAPLSLQAHPSSEQAQEGFARENALGIPLTAPERNYKDSSHKPELIFVLSPVFEALCGFRAPAQSIAVLDALAGGASEAGRTAIETFRAMLAAGDTSDEQTLRMAVAWLLGGTPAVVELVRSVTDAAARAIGSADAAQAGDFETVGRLASAYPLDPGIVLSLLLNRVTLHPGDALYLPAGNIHAYLSGVGIELMAASDNVLRGGLTPKHIDVPELLSVLSFVPMPPPLLVPESPMPGVEVFRPDVPDFALTRIALEGTVTDAQLALPGPAIALCTSGRLTLAGESGELRVERGQALYVTPDERRLTITGTGALFVATANGSKLPG
jgi:mannose-6-phosphate isomerase